MRIRGYPPATPCWAELTSGDLDAATTFYGGLFGWQSTAEDRGTFRLRGLAAAGLSPTAPEREQGWVSYLATDDLAATSSLVADAGGTVLRPATEVPAGGWAAIFADPEGAVFGAWQKASFAGAQVAGEPGATCWLELTTGNHAGAAAFYGKVFEWIEQPSDFATGEPYGEWLAASRVVAGIRPSDAGGLRAHWQTSFEVEDCALAVARCVELGGAVASAPSPIGIGSFAALVDPVGARFGVISLLPELRT